MLTNEQVKVLVQASQGAYTYGINPQDPIGYHIAKEFGTEFNNTNGFHAKIYQNNVTKEYIVAFTGTEPHGSDAYTDLNLGRTQYEAKTGEDGGQEVLAWIYKNIAPNTPISITGHSLGGALAQYLTYDLAASNKWPLTHGRLSMLWVVSWVNVKCP